MRAATVLHDEDARLFRARAWAESRASELRQAQAEGTDPADVNELTPA